MPFKEPILFERELLQQNDFEAPWGRIARAAMETENSVGSFLSREDTTQFQPVDGYDPFDDLEGYEDKAHDVIRIQSPEQMAAFKVNVDRQRENREILGASGWKGVVASVGAAGIDPLFLPFLLIPGSGVARIGSRSKSAIAGAAETFTGASLQEMALHASQEERTKIETLIGVTGATFVGGLIGGLVKPAQFKQIVDDVVEDFQNPTIIARAAEEDIAIDGRPRSAGSAQVAEAELVGIDAVNALAKISPLGQVMTSKTRAGRVAMLELAENAYRFKDEGINPIAIETKMKSFDGATFQGVKMMDDAYLNYRGFKEGNTFDRAMIRVKDLAGTDKYSRAQFNREVGRAMSRGDEHVIPEVAKAAKWYRKNITDPIHARMKAAGMLDDLDEGDIFAKSYFTRVYDHKKINTNPREFEALLAQNFKKDKPELDDLEAMEIARGTRNNILGLPDSQAAGRVVGKPGATKARVLTLSDEELEPWLIKDVEHVMRGHVNSVVPRLLMKEQGFDLKNVLGDITDEYSTLMAKNPSKQRSLEKEMKAVKGNLQAVHDRLLGIHKMSEDPTHWIMTTSRIARGVNFLSMLGGMTLSAIPDLARPVIVNGYKAYGKALGTLATSPKRFKMNLETLQKAGTALDMIQATRIRSMADMDEIIPQTKAERVLEGATNTFGLVSLMSPWNTVVKGLTGLVTQDAILRKSLDWSKGSISKADKADLLAMGIDEGAAQKIAKQPIDKDGALWLADMGKWKDGDIVDIYNGAMVRTVDTVIVTPGAGDIPRFVGGPISKMIVQFKSFALAANNRMLVSGLQQNDLRVYNSILLSMALGSLTYGVKQATAGRKIDTNPTKLLVEAIDRSGQVTVLMEANNIIEKMTGGGVGLNPLMAALTGEEHALMSRFATRNITGSMFGPTLGTVQNVATLTRTVFGGDDVTRTDVRSIGKILPYRNLFYLRWYLDEIEKKIADKLGAE